MQSIRFYDEIFFFCFFEFSTNFFLVIRNEFIMLLVVVVKSLFCYCWCCCCCFNDFLAVFDGLHSFYVKSYEALVVLENFFLYSFKQRCATLESHESFCAAKRAFSVAVIIRSSSASNMSEWAKNKKKKLWN